MKNKIDKCMVDTGATVSLFKMTAWSQLEEANCSLAPWEGHKLVGVEGNPVSVCGVSTLQLDIAGTTFVSVFVVVGRCRLHRWIRFSEDILRRH